ncbi:MAG TPA: M28 family peptidase [Solirubrobacteraceae bacterium]|jgi:Zn-dependent M28 family amino/carboxypeptidase
MRFHPAALAAAAALILASPASAATPTNTKPLQDAVKVGNDTSGIRAHLKKLQQIANANDGNRATGTSGHEASADYVIAKLKATGFYNVSSQPFVAQVWTQLAPPSLSATPAPPSPWTSEVDYALMSESGSGTLSGAPIAVIDFVEPTQQASTSNAGCEDSDFPASLTGRVAVIQRGTCDFGLKARKAQDRGAPAVIIFNEGTLGDPDRNGLINGTVEGYGVTIPVLEATYAAGRHLVDHPSATVSLSASTRTDRMPTRNVIAQTKSGRTDRTVVVGAHMDSVPEGPGINDDGSGIGTDLEVALQMAKLAVKPVNAVRFIWFSGEEQGLLGSDYYVSQLTKSQRNSISAMLDFDMLASPNYAELIYDGDGSEFPFPGPNGSGTIEKVFQSFFDKRGEYTERIPFDGRSDYDAFTTAGIPAGGIFTGAEEHKTPDEVPFWGGTVSETLAGQYDPCYHLACDSYPSNINNKVLDIMSDAVAHAVLTFSQTTSAVRGTDKASSSATKPYDWKGDHLRR